MKTKITQFKQAIIVLAIMLSSSGLLAQELTFSFSNAAITDGSGGSGTTHYEVDVMIETDVSIKLGAGQFFINYNTAAFGSNVDGNSKLTYTQPVGSVLADVYIFSAYSNFNQNDESSGRFSVSYAQGVSSGTFTSENLIISTPRVLMHLTLEFSDNSQDPTISFQSGGAYDKDIWSTACGPSSGIGVAECGNNPGTLINDLSFDNFGAALPATSTTWDGSENNNDWTDADNWSNGVPTADYSVSIVNAGTPPIITSQITVAHLSVYSSASLTLTGTSAGLTVTGLEYSASGGTFTLNSGSSLIVNESSSGNIAYNRTLGTTNWYLISSPVVGQDVDDFVTTEGLPTGTNSNKALATYNNGTGSWNYYQNGTSNADVFAPGIGREIKLLAAGDINFTGTMNVSDVAIELIDGASNEFNLIGNPYPSYIAVNDLANGTNNLFRANGTNGVAGNDANVVLAEDTIWVWDQSLNTGSGAYVQLNLASSKFIAPGQGFFVKRTTGVGTLNFNIRENMQSHQSTDGFSKSRNTNARPEIKLWMSSDTNSSFTEVYFIDGTTLGYDNGYDSTIFGGATSNFTVYTHLVEGSEGQKLGIQSVPNQDHENIIFPVGVLAAKETELTFSTKSINIPNGLSVILEDRVTEVFTALDQSSDEYKVTLNEDSNGIGRFYVHVNKMKVLTTDRFIAENISIYTTTARSLRITGVKSKARLKIFSILGKQVVDTSFEGNMVNDISLPSRLSTGIYIISLETENGKMQKKIVLD